MMKKYFKKRKARRHKSNKLGDLTFIWGVKAPDDMSQSPAGFYTMNDIDIVYSAKRKRYILDIETAYWFDSKDNEIGYLSYLLDKFSEYMHENNFPTSEPYRFWMSNPSDLFESERLSELYTNFKIFVDGYKSLYQ